MEYYFFNDTATTEIYTLSLHDALPICEGGQAQFMVAEQPPAPRGSTMEPLLRWLDESCGRDLTTARIAAHAGMSIRTLDRKSTRLNSSHANISYAVFCLKKNKHIVCLR